MQPLTVAGHAINAALNRLLATRRPRDADAGRRSISSLLGGSADQLSRGRAGPDAHAAPLHQHHIRARPKPSRVLALLLPQRLSRGLDSGEEEGSSGLHLCFAAAQNPLGLSTCA